MVRDQGILKDLRVLDLSRVLAGPFATMALGEMGARVVKVENVSAGDETRGWGPPFVAGESAYYLAFNRNKESIALDLSKDKAQEVVRHLALSWADIIVENFRPGMLERFNLGLEEMRKQQPQLITASVRGYPQGDDRPGYDFVMQGIGGLMSITGPKDGGAYKVGVAVVDLFAGSFLLSGILAALRERDQTGMGQHLSVSLFESELTMLANVASAYLITGRRPDRHGNGHPQLAPYDVFECSDGLITIGVGNDRQFLQLAEILDHREWATDERFATNARRVTNREALSEAMNTVLGRKTGAEWLTKLTASKVPCGPIRSIEEVFGSPEAHRADAVVYLDHPKVGRLPQVRFPWRFSRSEIRPRKAPPLHGQHTLKLLKEAQFSAEEIDQILRAGTAFQSSIDYTEGRE